MKECRTCHTEKHLVEFWKDIRNKDGYKSECKKCLTEKRESKREEIKIYNKAYRQRPHVKEKNRQRSIENWAKRNEKK